MILTVGNRREKLMRNIITGIVITVLTMLLPLVMLLHVLGFAPNLPGFDQPNGGVNPGTAVTYIMLTLMEVVGLLALAGWNENDSKKSEGS